MKTQTKTLRGIVTSSALALALVVGMVPAAGLAYAADQATQSVQAAQTDAASDKNTQQNEANETENAAASSDFAENAQAPANGASAATGEDINSNTTDSADSTESGKPAQGTPATQPSYTGTASGITSAEVPLTNAGETPAASVGTIEYAGLTYTINPENPTTVSVTGLATEKPKGAVQVQQQIAAGDVLYTVTGIQKNRLGGGSLLTLLQE